MNIKQVVRLLILLNIQSPRVLADVLLGLTTTISSTPGLRLPIISEDYSNEGEEDELSLEEALDAGLELTRHIVPVRNYTWFVFGCFQHSPPTEF